MATKTAKTNTTPKTDKDFSVTLTVRQQNVLEKFKVEIQAIVEQWLEKYGASKQAELCEEANYMAMASYGNWGKPETLNWFLLNAMKYVDATAALKAAQQEAAKAAEKKQDSKLVLALSKLTASKKGSASGVNTRKAYSLMQELEMKCPDKAVGIFERIVNEASDSVKSYKGVSDKNEVLFGIVAFRLKKELEELDNQAVTA